MKKIIVFIVVLSVAVSSFSIVHADDETITVNETMRGADYTHHIEVIPRTFQNQEIPYMEEVELAITNNDTQETTLHELHPMFGKFFHYGDNFKLEKKTYTFKFTLHPPTFTRDSSTQNKWIEHVSAEFQFDASKDVPDTGLNIGDKNTDDMEISFMAFPSKNMFEIAHSGDEHTNDSKEGKMYMGEATDSTTTEIKAEVFSVNDAIFIAIGLMAGIVVGIIMPAFGKKKKKKE